MGYPPHIICEKVFNTISKLNKPIKQRPKKCPVYFKLLYLGKNAKVMENSVRSTVDKTFKAVKLRTGHVTRKSLNGNYKDVRYDQ